MEKRTVDKRTITLYLGCGRRRHRITIPLKSNYYDEWYEQRLKYWNIEPKDISAVEIGPRTVVELFSSAFFDTDRRIVKNPSFNQVNKYEIGCLEDHHLWTGYVRSFRLWDYDHYEKIHSLQACSHHSDCLDNEYCLCPNGYARKEWCTGTGRFCFPKSRYLQSKPKNIVPGDLVNLDCLSNKLGSKKYADYSTIKRESEKCYPVSQSPYHYNDPNLVEGMCSVGAIDDGSGLESCAGPYFNYGRRANIEGFSIGVDQNKLLMAVLVGLVIYYIYRKY